MSRREKTLADVREDIMRAAGWMTAGIVIATIISVTFISLAVPSYRAQMIVSPASPMNGAELSALTANDNFIGLRYLAQRGSFNGDADFLRFENTVKGPTVAAKLLQDEKIVRGLSYDRAFGFSEPEQHWTPESLAEYIDRRVNLEPVGASNLRRMTYLNPSREFGAYFLYRLHRTADDIIRNSVRADAEARSGYLQSAIDETRNPEHRRALTALLMEQERLRMLASIDQPYAAAVIEPPSSSSKPWWPDALLIVPSLMFIGALLGFVLHGFFHREPEVQQSLFPARNAWFPAQGTNMNERRFSNRKAAE